MFCVRREEQEYRNALDHRRVEDVDAGVNVVADVLLRLLHETVNLTVFVRHDHSILGRVRNGLHHDGSFLSVVLMELDQLLERIRARYITIEHKEKILVLQVLLGKRNRARSSHGSVFYRNDNVDSKILLNRRNRIYHLLWHVAHSENYLLHADFRERTKLVEQDR